MVDGQLETIVPKAVKSHAGIAAKNGLDLIAYEAGLATGTPPQYHGDKLIVALFSGVTAVPGVEQTMENYLRLWFANGGKLICMFAYVNRPSQWGSWGNMGDYLGQPDNEAPRRRGILKVAKDPDLKTAR